MVPEITTKWVDPIVAVAKPPRRQLKPEDWTKDGRKEKIIRLHRSGMTCSEIQKKMKEDGLDASIASLKARFKLWGLRDYFNANQRKFILRERARRGKMPVFKYIDTNQTVDAVKVNRLWANRDRYSSMFMHGCSISISQGHMPTLMRPLIRAFKGIQMDDPLTPGGIMAISMPSPHLCDREEAVIVSSPPQGHILEDGDARDDGVKAEIIDRRDISNDEMDYTYSGRSGVSAWETTIFPSSIGNTMAVVQQVGLPASSGGRVPNVSSPDSVIYDSGISQLLLRVLSILNVPLDYHIQRGQRFGLNLPAREIHAPGEFTAVTLNVSRPQSPWRKIIGYITPMTPIAVETFMRSADVSDLLRQVNKLLLDLQPKIPPLLAPVPSGYMKLIRHQRSQALYEDNPTVSSSWDLDGGEGNRTYARLEYVVASGESLWSDSQYTWADGSLWPNFVSPQSMMEMTELERDELTRLLRKLNMAKHYFRLCEYSKAIQLLEVVLQKTYWWFGPRTAAFLDANYLMCQSVTMIRITPRNLERVRGILEWLTKSYRELKGIRSFRTRRSYNMLAYYVLRLEGQLDEAADILQVALANGFENLDPRPGESQLDFGDTQETTIRYLADVYMCQGKTREANALREIILQRIIRRHGQLHILSNCYRFRLAESYIEVRDFNTALTHLRELARFCHQRIAECLFDLDRLKEAQSACESVRSDIFVQSQSGHVDPLLWRLLGSILITLADIHNLGQDWKSALRYYEQSLIVYAGRMSCPTHHNARVATARICQVLIYRGPVLYLQPLAYYHIDVQRRFAEPVSHRVMRWLMEQLHGSGGEISIADELF